MLTFGELYTAYSREVFRFAYWLSGSSDDAEDITSETFVRAWTHLGRIRTETLKGFLLTIARNVYIGHLRKRAREEPFAEILPDPQPGPEAQVETSMALEEVQNALSRLGEEDRSAFLLRTVHQLEYAEIARVLQVSEGAVRVRVHRARKALLAWRVGLEAR